MDFINEFLQKGWNGILAQIKSIGISDIFDILLVSVLIYYVYIFIKDRRAGKLALGVTALILLLVISDFANLTVMKYLLQNIFQIGVIAIIIIFQPELRSMLENFVGESVRGLRSFGDRKSETQKESFLHELTDSVTLLSSSYTGALIVIEGMTKLGDIIANGTLIDAECSSLLIRNIFFNKSPLHDGALIIRNTRLYAAGCTLPLTSKNNSIERELGTRHRSALGMSEQSDALCIIVSEETGIVSVAYKGVLTRNIDVISLRNLVSDIFFSAPIKISDRKNRKRKNKEKTVKADETDE